MPRHWVWTQTNRTLWAHGLFWMNLRELKNNGGQTWAGNTDMETGAQELAYRDGQQDA